MSNAYSALTHSKTTNCIAVLPAAYDCLGQLPAPLFISLALQLRGSMGWLRWVERVEKEGGTRDDEYPQKVIQEKPMQPSLVEEKSQTRRMITTFLQVKTASLATPQPGPHPHAINCPRAPARNTPLRTRQYTTASRDELDKLRQKKSGKITMERKLCLNNNKIGQN